MPDDSKESDTPISDAAMFHSEPHGYEVVPYYVAQELERKLNALSNSSQNAADL